MAVPSAAGTVVVYDPKTLELVRQFTCPGDDNAGVAADADGNVFIGSAASGLWKVDPTGKVLLHVDQPVSPTDLDLSSDGKLLAGEWCRRHRRECTAEPVRPPRACGANVAAFGRLAQLARAPA